KGPMSNLFKQFGQPERISANGKEVTFEYHATFGFGIYDGNQVECCYFWPKWNQSVYGVNLGDSPDAGIGRLGEPKVKKATNAKIDVVWTNDQRDIQATFKDNKCSRIIVKLH